ncbi:hypothetical protein NMSP_0032 [Candidatus Nitrosomarinus catalina]|uniref:Uncharacterized protein n=1 Tax=Candidatus Nitrosomarinus catalinensis TaxID=1898749 RepID=A0A2Z2HHG0_9ARCH|nr:hypothetical protein [Candidatus Nitrosomarinus catalina]ARS63667.1 hypothetical protein NMSP_0032 [Candidatus Nitrosomarinus catalina]
MNKKILIMVIIPILGFVAFDWITGLSDEDEKINDDIFHITLADPELYTNGVYTKEFLIKSGTYFFRFVPNGSSPEILSIKLIGQNYVFEENFELVGIPHESETAKYFTWKYEGNKKITIDSLQEISITINPNGNVRGSVSVDLIR